MVSSSTSGATFWRGSRTLRRLELVTNLIVGVTFLWCFVRASRFAWYSMFTNFAPYDDEGYILLSVREFLFGRPLYDEVFTQYGPAYYAFKHFLSLFQGLPTHDITRWTTTGIWISSCSALGLAALWLTQSGIAATAVFGAMLTALEALPGEPGHPQELLILLTSLSVATAACPLRAHTRAVLLTAIAAVGCLTKIPERHRRDRGVWGDVDST